MSRGRLQWYGREGGCWVTPRPRHKNRDPALSQQPSRPAIRHSGILTINGALSSAIDVDWAFGLQLHLDQEALADEARNVKHRVRGGH